MNLRKTIILILMMILSLQYLVSQSTTDSLKINLAVFKLNKKEVLTTIDLSKKMHSLKAGDRLKFFYQPLSRSYSYFFHLSQDEALTLFFPDTPDADHQDLNKIYYIPDGEPENPNNDIYWFELDNVKGTETFYLIVSEKKQEDLETLTEYYHKWQRQKDYNKIHETKEALISLLESLVTDSKKVSSKNLKDEDLFTIDAPEFSPILGTVRANNLDIQHIQAAEYYGKKIQIKH